VNPESHRPVHEFGGKHPGAALICKLAPTKKERKLNNNDISIILKNFFINFITLSVAQRKYVKKRDIDSWYN